MTRFQSLKSREKEMNRIGYSVLPKVLKYDYTYNL